MGWELQPSVWPAAGVGASTQPQSWPQPPARSPGLVLQELPRQPTALVTAQGRMGWGDRDPSWAGSEEKHLSEVTQRDSNMKVAAGQAPGTEGLVVPLGKHSLPR